MKIPLLLKPMRCSTVSASTVLLLTAAMLESTAVGQEAVVTYYHRDATGNLAVMTDADGNVVWRASVRPFGRGSAQPSDRPLQFAGQPLQADLTAETGLYHLGARMFDPLTGRFLSPDPLAPGQIRVEEPQRFNRYAYGLNNPYRYSDASGLAPLTEAQAREVLKNMATVLQNQGATFEAKLSRILATASRTQEQVIVKAQSVLIKKSVNRVEAIIKAAETGEAELAAGKVNLEGFKKVLHSLRASGVIKAAGQVLGIALIAFVAYDGGRDISHGQADEAIDGFYDLGGFGAASDLYDPLGIYEEIFGDPRDALKGLANGDWNEAKAQPSSDSE